MDQQAKLATKLILSPAVTPCNNVAAALSLPVKIATQ